jgi:hypothetical protein
LRSTGSTADLAADLADYAQDAVRALAQALDQPRLGLAVLQLDEADQQPVAQPRRGALHLAAGRQRHQGRILAARELDQQVAVRVALDDVGHTHLGQGAGLGEAAPPALAQRALRFEVGQHLAQRPAVRALQPEGVGDAGLVRLALLRM